ncbi:MAG: hypothetical protein PHF86_07040 [Candidatus Nanoarchaeia archaeon]|nr:hypothetical protein [Candidatus Nanoarchaeia archaeon]
MKILPTITSFLEWKVKLNEVKELNLKEIALFPTTISYENRIELYKLLEETSVEEIPFVHLKSDFYQKEIDYLIERYNTKIFNIHNQNKHPLLNLKTKEYNNLFCVENDYGILNELEINNFGGVCLDFAHLEHTHIVIPDVYKINVNIINKNLPKCNHISAIANKPYINSTTDLEKLSYDIHFLTSLSEVDYLKHYPRNYFSNFIALELENSIKDQLKIIDYIDKLLQ